MGNIDRRHGVLAPILSRHIQPNMEGMIAERLGRSERTIEGWRYGDNPPKGDDLIGLFAVLGPAFVNEVLAQIGMGGAHFLNVDQCFRDVHVTVSRPDAKLTELGADGVFDHQDRAVLQPMLNEAAPKIAAAAGRKVA